MKAKWSDITASQQWGILNPAEKRTIIEEYSQTLPEKHRDMFKRGAELDVFTPEQLEAAGITEVTPDVRIKFAESSRNVDKNIAAYDKQQDEDWLSKRNIFGTNRAIGEGLTLGGYDELYATLATIISPFTDRTWLADVARDRGEGLTRGGFDELYSTIKPKPLLSDKTWSEAYKESKELGEKFHKAHPVLDTALQIGGGIGGAVLVPGAYIGKTALGTVGRNVGMGALAGALSGEGLEGRALSAGIGAALGGAIPGAAIGVGKAKDVIGTKILKGQYPEIYKALTAKSSKAPARYIELEDGTYDVDILNALMGGKTYSQQERLGNEMVKAARKSPSMYSATKASVNANVDTPFVEQVTGDLLNTATSIKNEKEREIITEASGRIAKGLKSIDAEDVLEEGISQANIISVIDDNIASLKGKVSDETYQLIKDSLFDLGMQRRVANRLVKVTAPQEKSFLSTLAGSGAAAGAGAIAGSMLGGVPGVGALLGALGKEALTGSATKKVTQEATKKLLNKEITKNIGQTARTGAIETKEAAEKAIKELPKKKVKKAEEIFKKLERNEKVEIPLGEGEALTKMAVYKVAKEAAEKYPQKKPISEESKAALLSIINALTRKSNEVK